METSESRRGFLRGVGLAAASVTIGAAVLSVTDLFSAADAQEATLLDPDLAAFAQTVELAAVAAHGLFRPRLTRPAAVAASTAFAGVAGKLATSKPNVKLLQTVVDQLHGARNEDAVIKMAYDLENGLAATHLFLLSELRAPGVLHTAASILPVESQHAVTFGTILGRPLIELTAPDAKGLGFESEDKHIDPANFPTVVTTTTAAAGE
jgi:hypothetical protein